jgi:uncharacterized RDD family membrane protein YckC
MNPTAAIPAASALERRPAGLAIRLAALTYESVLLFGVIFVVTYAVLAGARWTYPMPGYQRAILQAVLFVTLGLYFVHQWSRTGQTLAMKSWHLRLLDDAGQPPGIAAAIVRYVLAWHLVLPGAIWYALLGGNMALDALVSTLGFVALLAMALLDDQRRLLHDRLSATRIVRER